VANAVIEAVKAGDRAKVEELISGNAGLSMSVDDNNTSALLTAIYYGHRDIAELLASKVPTMTIQEAAALGDMQTLRVLSRWKDTLNSYSPDGWTALHLAAAFGGPEATEFLLSQGADPNARSKNPLDNNPLHACVAIGHNTHTAKLLIDKGADVNAVQHGGFTALHSAAFSGDLPMTRLLLDAGARLDPKTDDGQCALDLAREKGRDEVVKELEAAALDVRSM
jgi:ankyrin repeat protein